MGVHISTVLGRFIMTLLSGVAPSSSSTLSQISTALSISVPEKLSGEYSYLIFISELAVISSVSLRISFAPFTAISTTPCISVLNTTRRWRVEVEL